MKLLIIDDHPIVLSGCRALFLNDHDVTLLHAGTRADGLAAFNENKPDVTVIDINLPDGSGLELARQIRAEDDAALLVMFTMSDAPLLAIHALDAGARGFVSKTGKPENLREAVYAVRAGDHWLPPEMLQDIALMRAGTAGADAALTSRQLQVLTALARGRNMSEIAHELDVSYKTVANECADLRRLLNARTVSELVRVAVQLHLV